MAANSSTLSETQREMLKHLVVDISSDFKVAQCSHSCIYEVPPNLRKVNPDAYTPQLISIGPLHRKNPKLEPMETEKYRYFQFFWHRCERCHPNNAQELLQRYKSNLQKQFERIRYSYAVKLPKEYCEEEFVEMIFLDAVFIMELFLRSNFCKSGKAKHEENHDYMITKPWLHKSILRDLLLLENQIPMFVLEELYDTVVAVIDKNHSDFHELAGEYFLEEIHWMPSSKQLVSLSQGCASGVSHKTNNIWKNSRHFTDMIRYIWFASEKQESPPCSSVLKNSADKKQESPPSSVLKTATQLNEAGVTFEKVQNKCLLDIKFEKEPFWSYFLCLSCLPKSPFFDCFKARFKIPQLKVDHSTECLFRNLIAFEQCHYPDKPYICNYVSLIDSLIHTKDDVELLVEKEVISHDLGSHKELATVVNGLCKYVVVNETCYQQTIDELNTHYRNLWNRSMAALRLVYFRDPWRASSTVVGVAVLVFTIFNFCRILRVVFYRESEKK